MTISLVYDSFTSYIKKMLLYSKEKEKSSDSVSEILNVKAEVQTRNISYQRHIVPMVRKLKVFS